MTKAQWKAIYDYCEYNGIKPWELMKALKETGAIAYYVHLEELGDYEPSGTYDGMMNFLENSI